MIWTGHGSFVAEVAPSHRGCVAVVEGDAGWEVLLELDFDGFGNRCHHATSSEAFELLSLLSIEGDLLPLFAKDSLLHDSMFLSSRHS